MPDTDFTKWKSEWTEHGEYKDIFVEKLVVPIYPKIRLTFGRIYKICLGKRKQFKEINEELNTELYLTQIKDYKKFLLEQSFEDKETILRTPFPRFLWVIRAIFRGIPVFDTIYDGTSIIPKKTACYTLLIEKQFEYFPPNTTESPTAFSAK